MIYEAFLSHWLLDRDFHERRLCELREMKMAEQLNPVQTLLQAKFNIDAQAAVSKAWDALANGNNPDQAVAAFKKEISDLRARRDKLDAAQKEK